MNVEKRNGRIVEFKEEKIEKALNNANTSVEQFNQINEEDIKRIIESIKDLGKEQINVEEIQDIIEESLMELNYTALAREYIKYRYLHSLARDKYTTLMNAIDEKISCRAIENQNANVDEHSFGGRIGAASDLVMKEFALDFCMSKMAKENHLNNEIYIHDLNSYAVGNHNCLSIPFDDLLAKGFNTRQTDVRPANSINTAFQLVAVIFQIQSLQQFGGVAATHLDWTMVPYVRKSFNKHFRDGLKYIEEQENQIEVYQNPSGSKIIDISIDDNWYKDFPKAYAYAMDMTEKELKQAVEGMFHNLNTLQSRSGNQLPFTSINYGTCTLPEGRMVIKALLEGSITGVGKLHKTSIFPCVIFQCMNGVNRKEGDPNYDLFKLALKSTSLRLYPNYANVNWSGNAGYDPNDPKTYFSTMGKCKLQLI